MLRQLILNRNARRSLLRHSLGIANCLSIFQYDHSRVREDGVDVCCRRRRKVCTYISHSGNGGTRLSVQAIVPFKVMRCTYFRMKNGYLESVHTTANAVMKRGTERTSY